MLNGYKSSKIEAVPSRWDQRWVYVIVTGRRRKCFQLKQTQSNQHALLIWERRENMAEDRNALLLFCSKSSVVVWNEFIWNCDFRNNWILRHLTKEQTLFLSQKVKFTWSNSKKKYRSWIYNEFKLYPYWKPIFVCSKFIWISFYHKKLWSRCIPNNWDQIYCWKD